MIPPPPTPGASAPTPAALEAIPFLANGQRTTLAGAAGEGFSFRLAVPPGTTRLRLTLEGGHGECDLYVHYDIPPLPNRFADLVSRNGTAPSAVSEILDPAAGLWFLRVQGKTPFKDLTLSATYEPATPPAAIPSPPPSPETKPAM
jgi:hypothetical protein